MDYDIKDIKQFDPESKADEQEFLDEVCKKILKMDIKSDKERIKKILELLGFEES